MLYLYYYNANIYNIYTGNTNYGFNRSLLSRAEETIQAEPDNQPEQSNNGVQPTTSATEDIVVAIVPPIHSVNMNEQLESAGVAGTSNSPQESRKKNKKSKNRGDLVV